MRLPAEHREILEDLIMTAHEAILYAEAAAAEHGLEWNDGPRPRRFAIWPWESRWLVSSRAGDDGSGFTVVVVHDATALTYAYRIRPWCDYNTVRVVIFPLLLLVTLGALCTLVTRVIGFFSAAVA